VTWGNRWRNRARAPAAAAAVVVVVVVVGASVAAVAVDSGGHPEIRVQTSVPPTSVSPISPSSTTDAPSTTTPPTTASTTVATVPARQVLAPATTPPAAGECSQTIETSNDGTIGPLTCSNSAINIPAWTYYTKLYDGFMGIGPNVTESTVLRLMCADEKSLPTMEQVSFLTAAYYRWSFASNPYFAGWPFYPKPSGNECP
jgi:hypothetical protein